MDLDGTLADTAPGIHAAGARALADLGLPSVSPERARGFIGDGMPRFVKRLLTGERWTNPEAELFERAFALMRSHYARECAVASDLYPGARAALERFAAAKIPMACVTNKPAEFTGPVLKACGLDGAFASVVCGDAPELKKPRPDGLLRACRELGVAPGEAVMVGDSADTDLRAAVAAGCGFVGVSYGYGTAPFPAGTMVVDSLEELAGLEARAGAESRRFSRKKKRRKAPMSPPLEIEGLNKSYHGVPVLRDVGFSLRAGEFFGFAGINGAGKSTLLKCMLDFCHYESGAVRIFGESSRRPRARERVAFLPERFIPPYYLTGGEFLRMMAAMRGASYSRRGRRRCWRGWTWTGRRCLSRRGRIPRG